MKVTKKAAPSRSPYSRISTGSRPGCSGTGPGLTGRRNNALKTLSTVKQEVLNVLKYEAMPTTSTIRGEVSPPSAEGVQNGGEVKMEVIDLEDDVKMPTGTAQEDAWAAEPEVPGESYSDEDSDDYETDEDDEEAERINLKAPALDRLGKFSDSFVLCVRNEILKLKHSGRWYRNVGRAPMACYLLEQLLLDQN